MIRQTEQWRPMSPSGFVRPLPSQPDEGIRLPFNCMSPAERRNRAYAFGKVRMKILPVGLPGSKSRVPPSSRM